MHSLYPALPQSSDFDVWRIGVTLWVLAALAVYFNWEHIQAWHTRRRIERVNRKLARDFPILQSNYERKQR